jgi:hypothetical protein
MIFCCNPYGNQFFNDPTGEMRGNKKDNYWITGLCPSRILNTRI